MTEIEKQNPAKEDRNRFEETMSIARNVVDKYAIPNNHKHFLVIATGNKFFPEQTAQYASTLGLDEEMTRACTIVVTATESLSLVYGRILGKIAERDAEFESQALPETREEKLQKIPDRPINSSQEETNPADELPTEILQGNPSNSFYETQITKYSKNARTNLVAVLLEHHDRFPNIPFVETRIAEHIRVTRQRVQQLIKDQDKQLGVLLAGKGLETFKIEDEPHHRIRKIQQENP